MTFGKSGGGKKTTSMFVEDKEGNVRSINEREKLLRISRSVGTIPLAGRMQRRRDISAARAILKMKYRPSKLRRTRLRINRAETLAGLAGRTDGLLERKVRRGGMHYAGRGREG